MLKIEEPILDNLTSVKYNSLEKLENYYFENEVIKLNNSDIITCKFSGIVFEEIDIKFGKIEDAIFIDCDLSNLRFIDTSFYRVKFVNCKLAGTNFIDCELNNVIISDCMCNFINMANTKFKNIKLINSNFIESTIMGCKLKNILIEDINLSKSEIINTPLKDIDLSSSKIDEISTDLNSIKGVSINYYQAMDLIGLLGVKIIS